MRLVLIAAALLFVSLPAAAQEIEIAPRLRTGDVFRLEIVRIREDSRETRQNSKITTPVDIRVISATKEGFVIEWVPGESVMEQQTVDPLTVAAAEAVRDLRLRLSLSAAGEITGLVNEADVAKQVNAMFDTMMREGAADMPPGEKKKFEDFMRTVLSPANLIGLASRDAQMYLSLYGAVLKPGDDITVDVDQPNPLGPGTLAAKYRVILKALTADTATVQATTTYTPESLLEMSKALIARTGASIPDEELKKLPPINFTDDALFEFDRANGLMRQVTVNRDVTMDDWKRRDRWEIRLLKAPQR